MDYIKQETGWGIIPKSIMRRKGLSLQAKAIYAYLCGFAGNSQRAFPTADLITAELGISKNSFYKYLKELKDIGAVSVEKEETEDGTFGRNVYLLNNSISEVFDEELEVQLNESEQTEQEEKNSVTEDSISPCTKNPYTANCDTAPYTKLPYMVLPYTGLPYTAICDTNINNINKNNFNINNTKDTHTKKIKKDYKKDYKKDIKDILDAWNKEAELFGLPKCKLLTDLRKRKLMSLLKANKKDEIINSFNCIKDSAFLKGLSGSWKVTFDWILNDTNRVKVLEGNYDDKTTNTGATSNKTDAYLMNNKRQTDGMTEKELEQLLTGQMTRGGI